MRRRSSTRKTMRKNTNRAVTTIETIPREIASDILARVATDSLTDITNVKLSCKVLKEIAEDSYVYRHASLAKFPVVQWKSQTEEEKTFLNKCWESGNPEFLYRKGVVDYFSRNRSDSASEYLTTAARLGHVGALYVISIIFLYGDDEQKQKGITVLSEMKKSRVFRKKGGALPQISHRNIEDDLDKEFSCYKSSADMLYPERSACEETRLACN